MKSTLRKEILTETYMDMQKLIFKVVWNFWKIYGGDVDDLIGQANLIFIMAFDTYNSNEGNLKGKLTTWLAFRIRDGLFDYMMRNGNEYKLKHTTHTTQINDEFIEMYPASNEDFSVIELLDEMEQDAHIILQLFLETPREVMQAALVDKKGGKRRIDGVRFHMRNRLQNRLHQMGWTVRRIKAAFEEIKSVTSY